MKIIGSIFVSVALVFAMTASYIAVGQTFESASPLKASFKSLAFANGKMQLANVSPDIENEWILLVDNFCLLDRTLSLEIPGLILKNKNLYNLRYQALAATVVDWTTATDATIKNHPCVLGVSRNGRTQVQAIGGRLYDPLTTQQLAWNKIDLIDGDGFFSHPVFGWIQGSDSQAPSGQPINVAVVDSGIASSHHDLINNLWFDTNRANGFDVVNNDLDPNDDNGHGTHVAGLIGAEKFNSFGGRGVMGSHVKLMAVKTQDENGNGSFADLVTGVHWAVDHGAQVINLSVAGHSQNATVQAALDYAVSHGVVVVTAAGNDGEEITNTNFISPVGYAAQIDGVLAVGSIDAVTGARSSFSNYGSAFVELAAPGSADPNGILSTGLNGSFVFQSGTSMAAPQVSAAAALAIGFFKAQGISYSPAIIEQIIEQSAVSTPQNSTFFEQGRYLNIRRLGQVLYNYTVVEATGGFDGF